MHGFIRVAAAVPKVRVADVAFNLEETIGLWRIAQEQQAALVLFPELGITGYSCGDLFLQNQLLEAAYEGLLELVASSKNLKTIAIVGVPLRKDGLLYNCAAIIQQGRLLGVVPKSYLPEHKEYYEKRWFASGKEVCGGVVWIGEREVPFGVDLLFSHSQVTIGVEICEDLWSFLPPSSYQAAAGATLLCNLSASDEIVGKSDYREALVRQQSARCMAAYLYASCGMGESSTDVLFGGDAMIAENGVLLQRGQRFVDDSQMIFADVDVERLESMRRIESSYADMPKRSFRHIALTSLVSIDQLNRAIDPYPFVPSNRAERTKRCREIFAIQSAALQKRLLHIGCDVCVIGISGGLDSTLALLAVHHTYQKMGKDPSNILCVTMPGFGTTSQTLHNARKLCKGLGVSLQEIDITQACLDHFKQIGHDPSVHDLVFENVQARERTQILMDLANAKGGIVVGTGDLSEAALGWSTYNGDHMSMYAINIGIPKTLVRYIVEWAIEMYPSLSEVLAAILATPVSPELLPSQDDRIVQKTEEVIGPYALHDFFLYHMLKSGASPQKILFLASHAFKERYKKREIKKWLMLFLRRFFSQQFKRSCMPDGPKVGTIALSPRGDWRMPSDAVVRTWLEALQEDDIDQGG